MIDPPDEMAEVVRREAIVEHAEFNVNELTPKT
jgi:hypothetical protein